MRLNQVTVPALDLARSIAFYQTLGLRLIVLIGIRSEFAIGIRGQGIRGQE